MYLSIFDIITDKPNRIIRPKPSATKASHNFQAFAM